MDMMNIEFHEVASIFPMMSAEEFKALKASILKNGQRVPIYTHEGKIVDGRNRYMACLEIGVVPHFEEWNGEGLLCDFVWDLNAERRDLGTGAKQMAAARYAIELEKESRARSGMRTDLTSVQICTEVEFGRSRDIAAEKFGIAPRTVAGAVKVEKQGDESLKQAVESGQASVSAAAEVATLPAMEQAEIVAKGEAEILKAARAIKAQKKAHRRQDKETRKVSVPPHLPNITERYSLYHCPVSELSSYVQPASVDCIITDPPYPGGYKHVYQELGQFAAYALKPNGSVFVMAGQSFLPEIITALSASLQYHWIHSYLTPGGQSAQIWDRKVNTFWKPLLWFIKDEYRGDWVGDVLKSSPNDNDKRFHHWGQSESGMADIVHRFTYPGQVICDPFLGGGTTAYVALKMNRLVIGSDIDIEAINATKERLQNAASES